MEIHKILNLVKPICFLDVETTGTKVESDRIVEISIIKIMPDGQRLTYNSLVNPIIKIPKEASQVHGIYQKDVMDSPTFHNIAQEVVDFIGDADIVGYNSLKFDIPIIYTECERVGVFFDYKSRELIDACTIFKRQESRGLSKAVEFYLGKELENAHQAEADVEATIEVFEAQLERYDLSRDLHQLALYSNYDQEIIDLKGRFIRNSEDGELYYNFGKNKGLKCKDDPGYLAWILTTDMGEDVKKIVRQMLDEINEERKKKWIDH